MFTRICVRIETTSTLDQGNEPGYQGTYKGQYPDAGTVVPDDHNRVPEPREIRITFPCSLCMECMSKESNASDDDTPLLKKMKKRVCLPLG